MDSTTSLTDLINHAEMYLKEKGYKGSTMQIYRRTWCCLQERCTALGIVEYSYAACTDILKDIYGISSERKLTRNQVGRLRHLKVLDELYHDTEILRCYQKHGVTVPDDFASCLNECLSFFGEKGLMLKTTEGKQIQIIHFLCYLEENGIRELSSLNPQVILTYISSLSDNGYASQTRSGIMFTLREFLGFLYRKGKISVLCSQLFPVIFTHKNEKIPSFYSATERKKILALVDRDSSIGRRDFAILILAVQLGIRAGDIRRLKMENLCWSRNTIEFIQQKTGNPLILPMSENIKLALIDYIRNSRPQSESPFLFLRMRAPFEPYDDTNVFNYIITPYLDKAGIDYSGRKHGLHSMRHSLASSLLKENTPYPVITGILGHENSNTTRTYLSIDIEQLRRVALEVPHEK